MDDIKYNIVTVCKNINGISKMQIIINFFIALCKVIALNLLCFI